MWAICSAILLVGTLVGCEAIEDMMRFKYNQTISFTVPQTTVGLVPVINTPEIQSSSSEDFKNEGTEAKYVKTAYLESLTVTITNPANQNFDFVNEIELYIEAEGAEKVLIASKYGIDDNIGNTMAMDVDSSVNLKPYLSAESYTVSSKVVTDKTTNADIDIDADMEFSVTADVF